MFFIVCSRQKLWQPSCMQLSMLPMLVNIWLTQNFHNFYATIVRKNCHNNSNSFGIDAGCILLWSIIMNDVIVVIFILPKPLRNFTPRYWMLAINNNNFSMNFKRLAYEIGTVSFTFNLEYGCSWCAITNRSRITHTVKKPLTAFSSEALLSIFQPHELIRYIWNTSSSVTYFLVCPSILYDQFLVP